MVKFQLLIAHSRKSTYDDLRARDKDTDISSEKFTQIKTVETYSLLKHIFTKKNIYHKTRLF